ncbi:hypothetical protein DL770_003220 [Monosporascus sp. CRB-9-2]|nr:hypothetical protein DL770_003220 [Monosporascus sp. CRB-9-2]
MPPPSDPAALAAAQEAMKTFSTEAWTLLSIGLLVTIIRTFGRVKALGLKGLQPDDYLVWVGATFYAIETGLAYSVGAKAQGLANNGMTDEERATLSPNSPEYHTRIIGSKIQLGGWASYSVLLWSLKASLLMFYLRLTAGLGRSYLIRIYIGFGFVAVTWVIVVDPINGAHLAGSYAVRETFVAVVTTNLPMRLDDKTPDNIRTFGAGSKPSWRRRGGPPSPHHITSVTFGGSEERMVENVKMRTLKTPSDTNVGAGPHGNNSIHKDVEIAVTYEERSTEGPDRIAIPGIEENPEPRANHYAFARGPMRGNRMVHKDTVLPVGGGPVVTRNTFVMHRRREFFGNDSDDFRPGKWAEGRLRPGWELLPFKGGPRICPGQKFGLAKSSYTVARPLRALSAAESLDPTEWREQMTLSLTLNNGVRCRLTPAA